LDDWSVLALSRNDGCDPKWHERADTSLTRWIVPIGTDTFSNRHGFRTEFRMIDTKLAKAKVHRPAGGFRSGGQLVVDTLDA